MKVFLSLILSSLASQLFADTLTILNWEEYISERTIASWELRTGHKVKQIYFDNDEDRDREPSR